MSVEVHHQIPYFEINKESLIGLTNVIKKAKTIERECKNKLEEFKAQLKVKDFQLLQLQTEFDFLKSINQNSIQERYLELSGRGNIAK